MGLPGALRDWGQRKRGAGVWYERMRARMVGLLLLLLLFLLDRLQWVGGYPARCLMTAGERLGVRVLQGKGEMAGHRPRVR